MALDFKISKDANKFLEKQPSKIQEQIQSLKDKWHNFYHIRLWQITIIPSIQKEYKIIKINEIGFRGDAY